MRISSLVRGSGARGIRSRQLRHLSTRHFAPPTIDIGPLCAPNFDVDQSPLVAEVHAACKDWGFFQVVNHGIDQGEIQRAMQASSDFFSSSQTVKDLCFRTQENSRGYFNNELTKQRQDWKECFDFGAQNGSLQTTGPDGWNQWPPAEDVPSFREDMETYFLRCQVLSERLLQVMSAGLGMPPAHFQGFFSHHTSFLRLNFYPVCPDVGSNMAVHEHTDAGVLTVLKQDTVSALQVLRDGEWFPVAPVADAFTINVGDMIQVWSNDIYKAPVHRVVPRNDLERYSMPFFYNPSVSATAAPVPGTGRPCYRPVNWGDFRASRFAGDYADVGEEVQISQFRI